MTQEDQQKWDRKYSEANLYQEVSKVVLDMGWAKEELQFLQRF